jgi:uncharacterized protein
MTIVFADAAYYIALVSARDQHANAALSFADSYLGRYCTTTAVLTEVANILSKLATRPAMNQLWDSLRGDEVVDLVFVDETLWSRAADLYRRRADKEWSLTDCISFLVMWDREINEAVTSDHHFTQAGFTILM